MAKKVRYGMVGGSLGAFIGGVHRHAIAFQPGVELVAGCFDIREEENKATGAQYELDSDRVYEDYKSMAEAESKREDKIDFVSIVTPNNTHYAIAKAFVEKGINVVCEKPLCFTVEEGEELKKLAKENNVLFAITYTYSGYGMVKQAKELIEEGEIGEIINVNAEYLQDWLIDDVSKDKEKEASLSVWRKDPKVTGISNCVGDIGSHIEYTVAYMTGLKLKKVSAILDRFGQALDLNANMLVEYDNGVHGVYSSSQVCLGHGNGLVIRVFGTKGAIEWVQEEPDYLSVAKKGQGITRLKRGEGYITGRAVELNRIPTGHPEGLFIAFANIYKTFIEAILKKNNGEALTEKDLDFPSVEDGVEGVKFIHAVVESDKNNSIWTEI